MKKSLTCWLRLLLLAVIHCSAQSGFAQSAPIILHVDLRDAPRRLLHAQLEIPVVAGPLTLQYPKWIPGDHQPTGPIDNLAGLFFRAHGKDLSWTRDDVDMYALHLVIPEGVTRLDASLDFLATPGFTGSDMSGATSVNMTVLEWNSVLLYPAHVPVAQIPIIASLTMPASWQFGTALTTTAREGATVSFASVSVEQLVDSPLITGRYFREIPLAPEVTPKHYLDVAGDAAEDVDLKPEFLASLNQLVREAGVLYASHHYETYHFLLSLSDVVRHEGLEHHQSSDNGIEEKGLADPKLEWLNADLLPHEFTHSWNGKYRRPAGLATPDYATPMKGDLLWVYEGMTQYWGTVLAARSGMFTPDIYRDKLAWDAATLDLKAGRAWRNLQDTAIASQVLREVSSEWGDWRRDQDYYYEGALIWLDADTTIRSLTHGQKSLNDFCVKFLGLGGNTPPRIVPYDFDEVTADLNSVVAYDWKSFLTQRLDTLAKHAPLDGILHGGYRLVYNATANDYLQADSDHKKTIDAWFSLGLTVNATGVLADVRVGSPGFQAGLGPGTKLIAVNNHAFSGDVLKQAIRDAKGTSQPIEMIVSNDDEFRTVRVDYHNGEQYPHLERVTSTPGLLDDILKPLVPVKVGSL